MESAGHAYGALFALTWTLCLFGCASTGVPQPPSLELPRPVADLHASRKGDHVLLSWTVPNRATDRLPLHHLGPTYVCRGLDMAMIGCGPPVGQVAPVSPVKLNKDEALPKLSASYDDVLPRELQERSPTGAATYAVEVFNTRNRTAGLSNQVRVSLAPTLPPPSDFRVQVTAEGMVLTWPGVAEVSSSDAISHLYRIYRKPAGAPNWLVLADVPLAAGAMRFVDRTFEWQQSYDYKLAVVTTVSSDSNPAVQVEGDDTPAIHVDAEDVFPPAVPTGVQAVFSGAGQQPFIDIIWAPDTDPDLAGYNVYRRDDRGPIRKLNSELVKSPAYRDAAVTAGHEYFYSISAVDLRGNESARSQETSEKVP
jgi:hypothetical protein